MGFTPCSDQGILPVSAVTTDRKGGSGFPLGGTGEQVPLLGKQRLHPIDHRTHTGGAAQVTVDDDPVFGRQFGDRRGQPLEQGMAVADIAGQYAAAGAGAGWLPNA